MPRMMPTPPPPRTPPGATVRAALGDGAVEFSARLLMPAPGVSSWTDLPSPRSWFITHGFGHPAAGTYTEVVIDADAAQLPEHVLDAVVRAVAVELYERHWSFHYRPDEYADAIEQHGIARRERVLVEGVEVL